MPEKNAEIIPWSLTLDQARDEMLQGLLQGTPGHYRIGKLYNYVVEYRLAVNKGYRTTRAYFRHHVPVLSQARLTMYGAVVREFPPGPGSSPPVDRSRAAGGGAAAHAQAFGARARWREHSPRELRTPLEGREQLNRLISLLHACTSRQQRS